MCGCSWAPFLCPPAHGDSSLPSLPGHMGHRHGTMTVGRETGLWQAGAARGAVPAPPAVGQTAAWCLSAPPASPSPAWGQRLSASHRNQILPRDKILSPLFCGEKTTSAPGQTTESLSKGISGQGLEATSRSWNEEPAGVLAPGVLSPPGLSIPSRTRTRSTSPQHFPKDYSSSPRTQHLPHTPPSPTPDQNHLP